MLLIHQIPPKPDYLRVKVGRHLQRIGAVAIKNSVYVLPATEQAAEDFAWVLRDIVEAGGGAFICRAEIVDGLTDDEIERLFVETRARDYEQIVNAAEAMLAGLSAPHRASADRRRD
ncbi:MAG: ChrB protein, partial [Steroidobacteraceae bacterium]|nr:ChrB protein [Steroidobacteraceae bacterium]